MGPTNGIRYPDEPEYVAAVANGLIEGSEWWKREYVNRCNGAEEGFVDARDRVAEIARAVGRRGWSITTSGTIEKTNGVQRRVVKVVSVPPDEEANAFVVELPPRVIAEPMPAFHPNAITRADLDALRRERVYRGQATFQIAQSSTSVASQPIRLDAEPREMSIVDSSVMLRFGAVINLAEEALDHRDALQELTAWLFENMPRAVVEGQPAIPQVLALLRDLKARM